MKKKGNYLEMRVKQQKATLLLKQDSPTLGLLTATSPQPIRNRATQ